MKTARPTALLLPALALLSLAAGCGGEVKDDPAPLDRFTFPSGLAATPEGDLLVVSSNFDLTYDEGRGGSLARVDPAPRPAAFRGGARLPSFGGEVAIADAAACGLPTTEALVATRSQPSLHRLALGGDGAVACAGTCRVPFDDGVWADPYGVVAVCHPGEEPAAYVGFLRPAGPTGYVARVSLQTGEVRLRRTYVGSPRSFVYDAPNRRLFFTTTGTPLNAVLRWVELGGGCRFDRDPLLDEDGDGVPDLDGCLISSFDLAVTVRGAELQGIALSNPQEGLGRRMYVAARLFDPALAAIIGRPSFDVGGALLVFDLLDGPTGAPELRLADIVPIGLGTAELLVLPTRPPRACAARPEGCPRRDVVAVTAAEDGLLALYDDDQGALVKVFDRDPVLGAPLLGRRPSSLVAVPGAAGEVTLYVSSFADAFVTPVTVPLDDAGAAALVEVDGRPRRIGLESP